MNAQHTIFSFIFCLMISSLAFAGEQRGRLGVYLASLDDAVRQEYSYDGLGVLVSKVVPDSGADAAGLKSGDIIVSLNGKEVTGSKDLIHLLDSTAPGDKVSVAYFRGGETLTTGVVLGENSIFKIHRGPGANKWIFATGGPRVYMGIEMENLNDQLAEYFGTKNGILVTRVTEDSPAAQAGLKAGDVITSFAGQSIEGSKDLHKLLADHEAGQKVDLEVVRKGKDQSVEITLGSQELNKGNYFQFYSDDDDAIIAGPHHLKDFEWTPESVDIHIPEIEIHKMMRSVDDMEDFRSEMEALKEELDKLKKELKEYKEAE